MPLKTELLELRHVSCSPGEALYQRLTDLMLALEADEDDHSPDAQLNNNNNNNEKPETSAKYLKPGKNRQEEATNVNEAAFVKNGEDSVIVDAPGAFNHFLPVSVHEQNLKKRRHEPGERKGQKPRPTKKPQQLSNSPTVIESESGLIFDQGIDQDKLNIDNNEGEAGSDDTDCARREGPSAIHVAKRPSTVKRDRQVALAIAEGRRLLDRPLTHQFMAESDSFPETLTPSKRQQRKKRLIKRMSVDVNSSAVGNDGMEVDAPNLQYVRSLRKRNTLQGNRWSESIAIDMDCNVADEGSSISSSDCEGHGGRSSDDGRQGDDEQSDWVEGLRDVDSAALAEEKNECMGIPVSSKSRRNPNIDRRKSRTRETRETASGIQLNLEMSVAGTSQDEEETTPAVHESSDTDMSHSSHSKQGQKMLMNRRWLARPGIPVAAAINRKFLRFVRNANQRELSVSQLRRGEKRELIRLAAFYHLNMRMILKRKRRCLVFTKSEN